MSEEFSFTVLKSCSTNVKSAYIDAQKHLVKIVTDTSNLSFNETCSNNTLLLPYTNLYKQIYINMEAYSFPLFELFFVPTYFVSMLQPIGIKRRCKS